MCSPTNFWCSKMLSCKFLRGLVKKCFRPVADNNSYEIHDFLHVLVEAAEHNDYLEGTCQRVPGAFDAETLFNRLEGVDPQDLVDVFKHDVLANVAAVKRVSRNRKVMLGGDITNESYYGEDFNEWIHRQKFDKGATGSYQFLVVSALVASRREILGVLPLRRGDDVKKLVLELLDWLKGRLHVDGLLLDRGFDSGWLIRELKRRRTPFLMLWRQTAWTRKVFADMGRSKWLRQRHTVNVGDSTVSFTLVFVKGIRLEGDEKAYRWVFATNMRYSKPVYYIRLYKRRWGIETLFRVLDGVQVKTKTTDMGKRFFLVLVGVYLYNTWKEFLSHVEFHVSFSEYTSHIQGILEELHPKRPPNTRQRKVRNEIKNVFGFNTGVSSQTLPSTS